MSSLKYSLLLLTIALLFVTATSHEDHDYKCTHGQDDQEEPEIVEVNEDFNPEGNNHEGRTLADYPNMRFRSAFNGLSKQSASFRSYVQYDLIPPVIDFFSGALKVKYPLTSNFRVTSGTTCGVATPAELRSGVAADYVYLIDVVYDTSGTWVASTKTCQQASGSRRPILGKTTINTARMGPSSDIMRHERNVIAMMHELHHTLGLTTSLYRSFLDARGRTLTGHVTTTTLDGRSTTVLNIEPLTSMLREHFGCPTLRGAYLENTGAQGAVAGVHFERRQFSSEAMTSHLLSDMRYSKFSLGFLEGTGWYIPDYSYADSFGFGEGQGCGFLLNSCSSANGRFRDMCTTSARTCAPSGSSAGSCSSDGQSNGCRFVHANNAYSCENANAAGYARLPSIQAFGKGKGSKCFEGTLSTGSTTQTTFCFRYECSGSGSSTQLDVILGSKTVNCPRAGNISVSGYKGTIKCPDPKTFCNNVGKKNCPRGCTGRGSCVNGSCVCRSGFKGGDCSLRTAANIK